MDLDEHSLVSSVSSFPRIETATTFGSSFPRRFEADSIFENPTLWVLCVLCGFLNSGGGEVEVVESGRKEAQTEKARRSFYTPEQSDSYMPPEKSLSGRSGPE